MFNSTQWKRNLSLRVASALFSKESEVAAVSSRDDPGTLDQALTRILTLAWIYLVVTGR